MTAVTPTKYKMVYYHLGRLVGYLLLGGLAGFFGKELFGSELFKNVVPWVAVLSVSLGLIFLGLQLWRGKQPHLQLLPQSMLTALYRRAGGNAGAVGLLSAFLPCGWLHTYVLGALATQSPWYGAGFLLAFWLGTLPAMSFAPTLVRGVLNPLAKRAPRLSAVLLIGAGFFSIGAKVVSQVQVSAGHASSCHNHTSHH